MNIPTFIIYTCEYARVPEFIRDFVENVAKEIAADNGGSMIEVEVFNKKRVVRLNLSMRAKQNKKISVRFEAICDSAIDLPKYIKRQCEAMPDLIRTRS